MLPISIIITHWAQNDLRSELLRRCISSLIATTKHLPVEIIVVDNGANQEDSRYLLELAEQGQIQHYVRNSTNLYFGPARNYGVALSCGRYLVFSDNDIEYKQGWLDKAISILTAFPDRKYLVTPLRVDHVHRFFTYPQGDLEWNGEIFALNTMAGSNSWVMRREDFDVIGPFEPHYIAGTLWLRKSASLGYVVVAMHNAPLAEDLGFKRGYNYRQEVEIKKTFLNGETQKL